jgi:Flp pilus assembly secretin CpaC
MKRAFLKNSFIFVLGLALCTFNAPRISADEDSEGSRDIIDMVAGDVQSVTVNNLTRVSVTNPEVADIADAQSDKISVLAKKAGETVLFLWDASGKRDVKVRVVSEDLGRE